VQLQFNADSEWTCGGRDIRHHAVGPKGQLQYISLHSSRELSLQMSITMALMSSLGCLLALCTMMLTVWLRFFPTWAGPNRYPRCNGQSKKSSCKGEGCGRAIRLRKQTSEQASMQWMTRRSGGRTRANDVPCGRSVQQESRQVSAQTHPNRSEKQCERER
jgi:hypothetical protein